jgi:hypothetical protein
VGKQEMSATSALLHDFELFEKPRQNIIDEYQNKLPAEILDIWHNYGFGSFLNGYLKIVNPNEYDALLKATWTDYQSGYFVLFATGMGDLLVKKSDYLYFLNFRHNNIEVAAKDYNLLLNRCLTDEEYLEDELTWVPYKEAALKLGVPAFDECFGYEPLLAAGGSERVENLKRVKLIEHIALITQFAGQI